MQDLMAAAYDVLTKTLRELYEEEEFAVEHGAFLAMLPADSKARVISIPPFASKNEVAAAHRKLAALIPEAVIAFIDEAYRTCLSTKNPKEVAISQAIADGRVHVEDLVNREEGVMMSLRMGQHQRVGWCGLDRANKTMVVEPLLDTAGAGEWSGRFVGDGTEKEEK